MKNVKRKDLKQILLVSSYPPRKCGVAFYSHNLFQALKEKFSDSFTLKICALETDNMSGVDNYPQEVKYVLNTSHYKEYIYAAEKINKDRDIKIVFIQHDFSLFEGTYGENILYFLYSLNKPVIITFHSLPLNPDDKRKQIVKGIAAVASNILVMTNHSVNILIKDYQIAPEKISVISHGTLLINTHTKDEVKEKLQLNNRRVLSTFGLLKPGKSIETVLDALPAIVKKYPDILYLIIGKTHPEVINTEGEQYRSFLEKKVENLKLKNHVLFINQYLKLEDLLVYLQVVDIYLFTSNDQSQMVSGSFAYAMSCGCPVISTPIPHAVEMLDNDAGIIIDFQNHQQVENAVIKLLEDPALMKMISQKALHNIRPAVWENSAITHARIFQHFLKNRLQLKYNLPEISLRHINKLTDNLGIIQFSNISEPDINSGYTLDDNAHALIALSMHYHGKNNTQDLSLIDTYLSFIEECQQPDGTFLNYVNRYGEFGIKRQNENLEESNSRTILALGTLYSYRDVIPEIYTNRAECIIKKSFEWIAKSESPIAIATIIKGLYLYNSAKNNNIINTVIKALADNLIEKFDCVSESKWDRLGPYFFYDNSALAEGLLYAYLSNGSKEYKHIAKQIFDFLLTHLFRNNQLKFNSGSAWPYKGAHSMDFQAERPIDVSYIIQSLQIFYEVFKESSYKQKIETAFSWFLGNNYLNQIVYDPLSGGCNDGLEKGEVNLNQGGESTTCYLIARIIMEKHQQEEKNLHINLGPGEEIRSTGRS